ncbi:MAG TPA: S26 family signal peptidase [Verrucomicrobiae bacterium]|nr:S26 family signal peptidase [Verrucomicrobiae bacterium]
MGSGKPVRPKRAGPWRVWAAASAVLVGWVWRWGPSWVRVEGESMAPLLPPGCWVMVTRVRGRGCPLGAVVVAGHPARPEIEMIKRVVARTPDGMHYWLGGDDRVHSTDSDVLGPVGAAALSARARLRLLPWPPRWLGVDPGAIGARTGGAPPEVGGRARGARDLRP